MWPHRGHSTNWPKNVPAQPSLVPEAQLAFIVPLGLVPEEPLRRALGGLCSAMKAPG